MFCRYCRSLLMLMTKAGSHGPGPVVVCPKCEIAYEAQNAHTYRIVGPRLDQIIASLKAGEAQPLIV